MVPSRILLCAVSVGMMNSAAVLAHHPGHGTTPVPRATFTPTVAPPPPPVVAPPPPRVQTPSLNLPAFINPSIVLPTDTTGFRGSVRTAPVKLQPVATEPDKRFDFAEQMWEHFSSDVPVAAESNQPVVEKVNFPTRGLELGVEYNDLRNYKFDGRGMFLPTANAKFSKVDAATVNLAEGAVIVRASSEPVFVQHGIGSDASSVEVHGKALSLISVIDDRLVVINLTDSCCASVIVKLPVGSKIPRILVESGQLLEVYKDPAQPNTNLVASKVLINERLSDTTCMLLTQAHYVRVLKRFQLTQALPKEEMERVLKTAAAVSHVRP